MRDTDEDGALPSLYLDLLVKPSHFPSSIEVLHCAALYCSYCTSFFALHSVYSLPIGPNVWSHTRLVSLLWHTLLIPLNFWLGFKIFHCISLSCYQTHSSWIFYDLFQWQSVFLLLFVSCTNFQLLHLLAFWLLTVTLHYPASAPHHPVHPHPNHPNNPQLCPCRCCITVYPYPTLGSSLWAPRSLT